MGGNIIKKSNIGTILLSCIILIFVLLPEVSILAQKNEQTLFDCYGFIVPLPSGKNTSYETFLNSKARHLINDLLRENITVY